MGRLEDVGASLGEWGQRKRSITQYIDRLRQNKIAPILIRRFLSICDGFTV